MLREAGACGALRGGANPDGVLADPPNDEAPGATGVLADPPNEETPGATGAAGEITEVPGTGAPD